jgi:hypothetical protein
MQEHAGLVWVHKVCTEMSAIWRPGSSNDLGIDGHIEFLEQGSSISTGLIIGVQIKSGTSYFQHENSSGYVYYASQNNARYWKNYILPAILVCFNPNNGLCLFTDLKAQSLISDESKNVKITISKKAVFNSDTRKTLIEVAERFRIPEDTIARTLRNLKVLNYKFNWSYNQKYSVITGIDLLLAIASLKYLCFDLHESRIHEIMRIASNSNGISYDDDHITLFVERFCMHISQAQITEPFWDEFVEFLYGYKIFPEMAFSINEYGVKLIHYLIENVEDYIEMNKYEWLGIQEPEKLITEIQRRCEYQYDRFYERDKISSLCITDRFF